LEKWNCGEFGSQAHRVGQPRGGTHLPGLVALWSGDGDGNDSVGGNTATLTDISFEEGKVGQAFLLME